MLLTLKRRRQPERTKNSGREIASASGDSSVILARSTQHIPGWQQANVSGGHATQARGSSEWRQNKVAAIYPRIGRLQV